MSFSPSDVITVVSSLFPIREDIMMTRTLTIEVMIGKKMTSVLAYQVSRLGH